jgi:hypothetical protein
MKIFVQIASYRDPELNNTINDLICKSKYPNNLSIGICWQNNKQEDSWDNLDNFNNNKLFKIVDINYKESKGACWARSITQSLYDGEDFSLQIDSHTRFEPEWDIELISMFENIQDNKAILTAYPSMFDPSKEYKDYDKHFYMCNVYNMKNGVTSARPKRYPSEYINSPMRGSALAAGLVFGRGCINDHVKYDPEFYFTGEEASLALRFFTHGYNLYHPNKKLVYHYYTRKNEKKHWSDHKNWHVFSKKARNKLDCLLNRNNHYDMGEYGLGKERTIEDWRKYSGIDYVNKKLHKNLIRALEPPFSDEKDLWVDENQMNHNKK